MHGVKQPLDPEALYRQLGRHLQDVPNFTFPLTSEHMTWFGRARALVAAHGDTQLTAEFDTAMRPLSSFQTRDTGVQKSMLTLYKVLGAAELEAPPGVRGSFIPAGNRFDAYAAVSKVLQTATRDLLMVDPYLDETVLTDFGGSVPEGVTLRLLADRASVKSSLEPAARMWVSQYGTDRPLAVRFSSPKELHDRAVFVDGTTAWVLTQSLKDFAKRSPAEIVRADDTAALKIAAYEALWLTASVVV